MKMKTNKFVCILAVFMAAFSLHANPSAEGIKNIFSHFSNNAVILVGKVETSGIDYESRLYPFSASPFKQYDYKKFNLTSGDEENPAVIYEPISEKSLMKKLIDVDIGSSFIFPDGEYFFAQASSKKSQFELKGFTFRMFPKITEWFAWETGPEATVTYSENAKYVYVGTFKYTFDYALNVTEFVHLDEYDEAKKMLSEVLDTDVKLYRAEINFSN